MRKEYLSHVTYSKQVGSPVREFTYADSCNSAKICYSFPIIGAEEKSTQPLSTQSKLSREL